MIRPGRKAHVLLVEDSPADVRLTKEAFAEGQLSAELHVVKDGDEAIAFLAREAPYENVPRPDLVLLDLNLPRKSGREVLRHIRTDPDLRTMPVIVLTTSGAEDDVLSVYELNANCYIRKPMDVKEFLKTMGLIESFWLSAVTLPPKRA